MLSNVKQPATVDIGMTCPMADSKCVDANDIHHMDVDEILLGNFYSDFNNDMNKKCGIIDMTIKHKQQ